MDKLRRRVDGRDLLLRPDHPSRERDDDLRETVVAGQVGRPHAVLAAVNCVDDGLVERREVVPDPGVALGDRAGVGGDSLRVGGVDELVVEPERRAVVHEIHHAAQPELLHVRAHFVEPAPIELARPRFHEVPRDAPADELGPSLCGEVEVLAPVLVVLHQFVLVEAAAADALLGHKGVLDPDAEVQALVGEPVLGGHAVLSVGPCGAI